MILSPAYGRDYKSKDEVLADFNANKDFIINDIVSPWCGKPVNRGDLLNSDTKPMSIEFRYYKLRKSFIHKPT